MSFQLSPATRVRLGRMGKIVLGVAVGASFGVVIGALVASWIWGVAAIEGEAVNSSYLAAASTLLGAIAGAWFGFRAGRPDSAELQVVIQEHAGADQNSDKQL